MGTLDRIIRTMLAIVVILLYLFGLISGITAIILIIFSVIFLLTSIISFCPLYVLLKISTLRKSDKER